jgi:diguanylate cyclase (GGDEF)-like protein/PAS domain S-box-containing protein
MGTTTTDSSDGTPAEDAARYRAIFDVLDEGLIVWGPDGRILTCNERSAEILGLPMEHLRRIGFDDLVHMATGNPIAPDGTARPRTTFSALVASHAQEPVVGQVIGVERIDGAFVWLEVDLRIIEDPHEGTLMMSSLRDITATKVAQDRLEFQAHLLEAVGQSVVATDAHGIVCYWNSGAEQLFGWDTAAAMGRPGDELVQALVTEADTAVIAEHLNAGRPWSGDFALRRHDGVELTLFVTNTPILDENGKLVSVIGVSSDITDQKANRDALAQSEQWFRSLVQHAADVAFVFDHDGNITYASPAVDTFGYTPDELIGTPSRDLIHPDDTARHRDRVMASLQASGSAAIEWRLRDAAGAYRWVEETLTDMRELEAVGGYVANVRDITDRKQAERERIEAEERFRQGFERSAFGLAILDLDHSCTSANTALADLLGYPVEQLIGRRPIEFMHPAEADTAREGAERLLRSDGPQHYKREHRMVRADGTLIWVLIDMTVVRDARDNPAYFFVQVRDIADRKRVEEALEHQALHDDLTRLPNRLLLVDRLAHSLARTDRSDRNLAVLFLDLDRFKLVNDGLGHVVGDQLLVEVAQRLQHAVRGSDTVARFGGDEFVIVREEVHDVKEAIEFAERVAKILREPIALSGRELYATASIGIAMGGHGSSAEQLLRDADAAMYRAKDLGRSRIELFSHELQQRVAARLDLESALRQAIERDELELLYQPIVRLADGRVVGAEALLRWHREGHGVVVPADFIPVAEETGLIVPIGTWALEHALTELRALTRTHDAAEWPLLAVNLSALQLRLPTSIEMVRDAIRASGVDPSMLSLEITESALMDDIDQSAAAMHALRDLGVRLAVDDFGTGYSSLAYLKKLPVDSLKIDRSFINGLPSDPHDRSITEAIVTLGRSLDLTIVAEGVETVEQWIALDELGCTVGQGFLWSPPIPAAAFAPLITGLRRTERASRDADADAGSTRARKADAN